MDWTDEEADLLRKLRGDGRTRPQIAKTMRRSYYSVAKKIARISKGREPAIPFWTNEKIELFRQLWLDGLSCSKIAAEIGYGCTKNAVVGKRYRLDLPQRKSGGIGPEREPERRREIARQAARARWGNRPIKSAQVAPPRAVFVPVPIECVSVAFLDLNQGMCKWPTGDNCYCGNPAPWRAPYCLGHHALSVVRRAA